LTKSVCLCHNVGAADDIRWNGVVFTIIGKLLIFLKVVEMAGYKKAITFQIDGCYLVPGKLHSIFIGFSAFLHHIQITLACLAREEDRNASVMIG